jgi:hypothetical protein
MTAKKNPVAQDNKGAQANVSPEKKETPKEVDTDIIKQMFEQNKVIMAKLDHFEKENKELKAAIASKPKTTEVTHDEAVIDDYLETPVVFFCYNFSFSIHGYINRGKEHLAPNGPVRFKLLHRYPLGTGAQAKFHSVAGVKIHSRKELEFLRNHPGFGYRFHEKVEGVARIDTMLADILTREAMRVNAMSDHSILEACINENIPRTTDITQMRKQLISKRADTAQGKINSTMKHRADQAIEQAKNANSIMATGKPEKIDMVG